MNWLQRKKSCVPRVSEVDGMGWDSQWIHLVVDDFWYPERPRRNNKNEQGLFKRSASQFFKGGVESGTVSDDVFALLT